MIAFTVIKGGSPYNQVESTLDSLVHSLTHLHEMGTSTWLVVVIGKTSFPFQCGQRCAERYQSKLWRIENFSVNNYYRKKILSTPNLNIMQ